MPRFKPNPDDRLLLPFIHNGVNGKDSIEYRVEPAPVNATMAYCSVGGKAKIYRLARDCDQTRWALKVFFPDFRSEQVLQSRDRLSHLVHLPGLLAAARGVITPDHEIVSQYSELQWAVLMPWISGTTCFDLFSTFASSNATRPAPETVDEVASKSRNFLEIMSRLEGKYTHTDISSGNLILASNGHAAHKPAARNHADTQLIDLEDVWRPGIAVTTNYTAGYGHPSLSEGATTACPEGDRYATIILAAEILLLSSGDLNAKFVGDGYFRRVDRKDSEANARYEAAQKYLGSQWPEFASALAEAWESKTLADCVPIASLLSTITPRHGIFDPPPPPQLPLPPPQPPASYTWKQMLNQLLRPSQPLAPGRAEGSATGLFGPSIPAADSIPKWRQDWTVFRDRILTRLGSFWERLSKRK